MSGAGRGRSSDLLPLKVRAIGHNADARRREILDGAAELFERVGYSNASVEDIASVNGIGKATLYHYFASREEIVFAMHQWLIDEVTSQAQRHMEADLTASQKLRALMGEMLHAIGSKPGYVHVSFEHNRELSAELREQIVVKRDRFQQMVQDIIRDGVASGEFRDVDPSMAALTFLGIVNWSYQWFRRYGPLTSDDVADALSDLLFSGLAAPHR